MNIQFLTSFKPLYEASKVGLRCFPRCCNDGHKKHASCSNDIFATFMWRKEWNVDELLVTGEIVSRKCFTENFDSSIHEGITEGNIRNLSLEKENETVFIGKISYTNQETEVVQYNLHFSSQSSVWKCTKNTQGMEFAFQIKIFLAINNGLGEMQLCLLDSKTSNCFAVQRKDSLGGVTRKRSVEDLYEIIDPRTASKMVLSENSNKKLKADTDKVDFSYSPHLHGAELQSIVSTDSSTSQETYTICNCVCPMIDASTSASPTFRNTQQSDTENQSNHIEEKVSENIQNPYAEHNRHIIPCIIAEENPHHTIPLPLHDKMVQNTTKRESTRIIVDLTNRPHLLPVNSTDSTILKPKKHYPEYASPLQHPDIIFAEDVEDEGYFRDEEESMYFYDEENEDSLYYRILRRTELEMKKNRGKSCNRVLFDEDEEMADSICENEALDEEKFPNIMDDDCLDAIKSN